MLWGIVLFWFAFVGGMVENNKKNLFISVNVGPVFFCFWISPIKGTLR